jgi:hypothetical protein
VRPPAVEAKASEHHAASNARVGTRQCILAFPRCSRRLHYFKKNETIDKRRHERCMRDPFKQFQLSSSTLRYSGLIVAVFVFHDDMITASMFQDQISEQMFSS